MNVQHHQRTIEAFNRLPEEFTNEDVMRCFNLSNENVARVRVNRLMDDHLAQKVGEKKVGRVYKGIYRKTGAIIL